jgi:hypothetical protein
MRAERRGAARGRRRHNGEEQRAAEEIEGALLGAIVDGDRLVVAVRGGPLVESNGRAMTGALASAMQSRGEIDPSLQREAQQRELVG